MKKKVVVLFILLCVSFLCITPQKAKAETLNDNITEQLDNLDIDGLEDYLNGLTNEERALFDLSFYEQIKNIIDGKFGVEVKDIFNNLFSSLFSSFKTQLPHFVAILAISVICGIVSSSSSNSLSNSTKEVIFFVCIISVILIVSVDLSALLSNTKNTLEKLTNLSEIMLPIVITLMIAGGGNVSAAMYKPAVAFLSNGICNIFINTLLPLVTLTVIFAILSNISNEIKLNKMCDFVSSLIKWIIGLSITVFSFFMTAQGLTGASVDGISFRAAKYALSNSIPIVGGFIKDGFDIVLAGSILLKNAVGLSVVLLVFSLILTPLMNLIAYQLLLKLFSGISEPIGDSRVSSLLAALSKSVSFLIAIVLAVGLMLFISLMLLIVSANSFI